MDTANLYQYFKNHPIISTDTRNILPESLYFALKGENFNGNAFAEAALNAGASFAIIDDPTYSKDERCILVDDVLTALQDLAKYHRVFMNIPIIGITGTNGKTTTKELMSAVLREKFNTYATKGNLNNHIGVPLSILEINSETEIAIIEMGANHPKEIALLCSIAQPTHGLITNVGKAHLEGFGGFEGVKKSKAELYKYLSDQQCVLFLQNDNLDLVEMVGELLFKEVTTYGFFDESDVYGRVVERDPYLAVSWTANNQNHEVRTQIAGSYNLENILASITVGLYFGIEANLINHGLETYVPQNNRSQLLKTTQNTIICDYYNANVSSMEVALENINSLKSYPKKVLILGDMFELGDASHKEHGNIMAKAMFVNAETCFFIGKSFFAHKKDIEGVFFFETTDEAIQAIKEKPFQECLILLKASRGMAFEKIVPNL